MQIIIPMTGYGSRFVAAGYTDLKPFIKVNGIYLIEWIVKGMFPGETDFLFVCRKTHLDEIRGMGRLLKELAPKGKICAVNNWVKKGPVYDVLRAGDFIDNDQPCIINYCDFYMLWDWNKFQNDVAARGCEGCIPCYTGYHPHLMIEKNVYASCLTDEDDNLIKIREKYSFDSDKTKAKHSPGTYYFQTGALLKTYCQRLVDEQTEIKGEYYASLTYNNMVKDGLKVWCPINVEQFCQWGTPEDMADYNFYVSNILKWKDERKK